ncbi:MAG: hypothetical protein Q7R41_09665, partial [Phycisphaerales bacterium]|nr:hypothetical protein [Phycisphaerales bacterium]
EDAASAGGDLRENYEALLQYAAMYDVARYIGEFAEELPIRIVIDDLDRNWTPRLESGNKLVVALLDVIHDLMDELRGRVQATVFIRQDVFSWLSKNDPEILRRDAGQLLWTVEGLELLVARRIAARTGTSETDPMVIWRMVFPEFLGDKSASEFIISRTHQRPRDVVQFCQKAIESAQRAGRTEVALSDVTAAWEATGALILGQIEAEFAFTFPDIANLAVVLMDGPVARRWNELKEPLVDTALRIDPCPEWMTEGLDRPEVLLAALYETGIVGVETAGGSQWFETQRTFDEVRLGATDDDEVIRCIQRSIELPLSRDGPGGCLGRLAIANGGAEAPPSMIPAGRDSSVWVLDYATRLAFRRAPSIGRDAGSFKVAKSRFDGECVSEA